MQQYTYTKT